MKFKNGFLLVSLLLLVAVFIYSAQSPQPEILTEQPTERITPEPSLEAQNQNPSHPLVVLTLPQDKQNVSSPLRIEGMASGLWFFEASFPIVLTNWDGLIIAQGYATTQDDWMTEEFVPFTSELMYTSDTTVSNRGTLILQKANPSGLAEYADAYEITVFFE